MLRRRPGHRHADPADLSALPPTTRLGVLGAAAIAALVCAGCGGGSEHLSKPEFVRRANAICKRTAAERDRTERRRFGTSLSKAELAKFAGDVLVPSDEREISQIRDLAAPKGDEAEVKAILDARQAGVDRIKADPAGFGSYRKSPFDRADRLARAYGLTDCA